MLFIVNQLMGLHLANLISMFTETFKMVIRKNYEQVMIYPAIILLIRLNIFLEINYQDYKNVKFSRFVFNNKDDLIKKL